jgi:hypothetical protein
VKPTRLGTVVAGALAALAIAGPATAQGKSGGAPGKKSTPPPAGTVSAPATSSIATSGLTTAASPFSWLDDASIMAPGDVWVGVSMVHWRGAGTSQTVVPVVDGTVGLAPRFQIGMTVPRVDGGFGTTFVSGKIGVVTGERGRPAVAVAPTLEIVNGTASELVATGQRRAHWGLPVSAQIDHAGARLFVSSGYFSPGIWYAGGGASRALTDRVGVSVSFSHAWTRIATLDPALNGPSRNDLSGGGSYDLSPNFTVFGSIGRTIGTSVDNGSGTTVSFGLSVNAAPGLTK